MYIYGELTGEICTEGLTFCNYMKLEKQLEKQRVLEKKEIGDFCEQFDFRPTTKLSARKPHKKHKKNL